MLLSCATAIPGLSFNNQTRNQLKVLQKMLVKGKLKEVSNIVIWHDVINNSISKHRSNNNTAFDVNKLLQILLQFKNRIKCIICTRRCGTQDIFEALVTTGILVSHTERHLSSKRNLRKPDYKEELKLLHPKQHIELTFISLILSFQSKIEQLVKKSRSKKRKLSKKHRNKKKAGSQ